ncbi:hypothetical protein CGZ98_13935 [Enemella evansiae]|uniref:alpha-N-acetylglucosaminidase n=1 Tax=Enemella evansiae TaxID=2016499 RepID=UPI000B96382D|nr:alpha-N-acetylglucosaminidase [Enemella evansiae]OYO08889.1 hypothetical protein CGZ98_13935 [Enemella evansiae]
MSQEAPFADTVRAVIERSNGTAAGVRVLTGPRAETGTRASARAEHGELLLRATDPVGALSAFQAYLQRRARRRITWESPELSPPLASWPSGAVEIATDFGIRYHLNVVTHGYSMAYWDWDRWERELDWMALHGITHPLILTGYESVLADTLIRLGIGESDAWSWVGSAAHVPWFAMGGMHSFGGPLPAAWPRRRTELAGRILTRARELGMTPVLPLTGGHVPEQLAGADADRIEWQGWSTPVLDPGSPAHREFVATFLAAQRDLLGDPGVEPMYALDPYIESLPPSDEPEALAAAGRGYFAALTEVVPDATWLLQGWPFHYHKDFWTTERIAAFLSEVPHERLLLIDLWGEHAPMWRGGMHGRRWIWSMVHNFGGRFGLFGDLAGLVRDLAELRAVAPAGLEGIGMAPEAIENNTVFYELATDLTWSDVDLGDWLARYAAQRYGTADPAAGEAWQLLAETLHGPGRTRSIPSPVYARPWTDELPFAAQRAAGEALPEPTRMSANIDAENDPAVLGDLPRIARAARLIAGLRDADRTAQERDVSDLVQHVIAQGTRPRIRGILAAYRRGDSDGIGDQFAALRTALLELDELAAARPDGLHSWLAAARDWGETPQEARVMERDARSLVSVWGHQTSGLHDYSGRHWAGLVGELHLARWQAWADWLTESLATGAPDPRALQQRIVDLEEAWREAPRDARPPSGDTIALALDALTHRGL